MNQRTIRQITLSTLAILISGLMACEKVIDISIPEKERKIVVNGLISNNGPVRVNLSRSLSVLEKDTLIPITGGTVRLMLGNSLIGNLVEQPNGFYFLPDYLPEIGKTYTLMASGGGLQPVTAQAVLPQVVPFQSVDTSTLFNEWGGRDFRIAVKFNDQPGVENIYAIGVDVTTKEFDYLTQTYTGRKVTRNSWIYMNSDGPVKDEYHNFEGKIYFDDLLFDGVEKTVEFSVNDYSFYDSDTIWMQVRLEQVDPSYFNYAVSNEAYSAAHGNPFAEPVQVYSNVNGGYGIFAGSSSVVYPLTLFGWGKFR